MVSSLIQWRRMAQMRKQLAECLLVMSCIRSLHSLSAVRIIALKSEVALQLPISPSLVRPH